jgi:hypothetical protein
MKLKILYLVILINIYLSLENYSTASEALRNYPKQTKKGGKEPKFLYFKMKPESCRNIEYYSRIFYNYLNTVGVRPYFSKIDTNLLLGMIPKDSEVDTQELKSHFSELVDDVYIKFKLD